MFFLLLLFIGAGAVAAVSYAESSTCSAGEHTHPLACVTVDVEQDVYAELVDCLSDCVVVQVRVVYEVVARSLAQVAA
jgi:hypothetical protein